MIRNNSEKVNINESGLNSVENDTVRNNLMGKSRFMDKKGWVDAQGRKVRSAKSAPRSRPHVGAPSAERPRSPPTLTPYPPHPPTQQGKGYGVYRYADKYGANVDGYSPIYTPDRWTESGDSYKLGTKGLIAW